MPLLMLNFFYEDHYQGSNLPLNIPTLLANGDVSTATAYKGNNNHTVKKIIKIPSFDVQNQGGSKQKSKWGRRKPTFCLTPEGHKQLTVA